MITATVVYFGIVKPYEHLKTRFSKPADVEPSGPSSEELLTEIRDLLAKSSR